MIDPLLSAAAHPDDAAVAHCYVEAAAVRTENAGRLHPPLDLVLADLELRVNPNRPRLLWPKGSPVTPDIPDPVLCALIHRAAMFLSWCAEKPRPRAQVGAYLRKTGGRPGASPPSFARRGPELGTALVGTYALISWQQDGASGNPQALEGMYGVARFR
jgi:hypothetical protein